MSKKEDNAIFIEKNLNKINKKIQKKCTKVKFKIFSNEKSVKPPENGSFLFFENFQCSKIFFIWIFEDWLTKPEPIWNVSKYTFTVILEKFRNLSQINEQRTI